MFSLAREIFRRDFRFKQIPAPRILQGRSEIREAYRIRCASAEEVRKRVCFDFICQLPQESDREALLLLGHESRLFKKLTFLK